jgi:hypothetical protein
MGMNATKHTGWVAIHDELACEHEIRTADTSGDLIATVWCGEEPDAEAAQHARLIAAAPDLLEALRDMLAGWRYIRSSHGDLYGVGWDRAEGKAATAIDKATGEAA